ncbi:hypothetical protein SAMN05216503_1093 [Polaribacter sp. KT25b]|uniref:hypothetical protein n=1 Tax=Polaribacter sp. KT25b TaxID=1855336 RepID=UPI000879FA42|nr:hypothetical protein [Polaribacter sp. KT25b]SDR83363.1 hypothetical protein SAMN05216503_1093 [Polaribacter sp. KT25b]
MKKYFSNKTIEDYNLKNSFIDIYQKAVIAICFLVSLTVMLGWFLDIRFLLSILPESATMKFNTALIFFIAGINLVILRANNKSFKKVYNFLAVTTIIIGVITFIEYFDISSFKFDNVFVEDNYSLENPGRMSPATALCSILLGLGFLGNSSKIKIIKKLSEDTVLFVALISLIALVSYFLMIPLEKRTYFFQSMAFHTSIVFFIISILLILNNNSLYIINLAKGKSESNKFFRKLLPKIIYFPIALGSVLLVAINLDLVNSTFGISSFILILIFINIIYISHISKNYDVSNIKENVSKNTNKKDLQ